MRTNSYLTSNELALRWRVTTETVRRWIREDTIPHTRIGRRKLIPIQALEKLELLRQGPSEPTTQSEQR
ncbi:MAG TPA: helix-turn-helix domain-containing protein [SAR324 cluster bacterium]|nr:helix-turn-helix domain-containing protein [SAR324 cluster bacterium]